MYKLLTFWTDRSSLNLLFLIKTKPNAKSLA